MSLTDGLVSLFIEWAQAGTVPTGRPPVESFDRDPGESTSKSILILAILYHVLSLSFRLTPSNDHLFVHILHNFLGESLLPIYNRRFIKPAGMSFSLSAYFNTL